MFNNPFFVEIDRPDYGFRSIELIPVYVNQGERYLATSSFRLYVGYDLDGNEYDPNILREQYFDNLELMGDDNPCFLGSLEFNGFSYFEWKYSGDQLTEFEVWQVVDLLQNSVRTYLSAA